jgi:hypothetical protein
LAAAALYRGRQYTLCAAFTLCRPRLSSAQGRESSLLASGVLLVGVLLPFLSSQRAKDRCPLASACASICSLPTLFLFLCRSARPAAPARHVRGVASSLGPSVCSIVRATGTHCVLTANSPGTVWAGVVDESVCAHAQVCEAGVLLAGLQSTQLLVLWVRGRYCGASVSRLVVLLQHYAGTLYPALSHCLALHCCTEWPVFLSE